LPFSLTPSLSHSQLGEGNHCRCAVQLTATLNINGSKVLPQSDHGPRGLVEQKGCCSEQQMVLKTLSLAKDILRERLEICNWCIEAEVLQRFIAAT